MYRTEHPNPQFERDDFTSLNGQWEFETGSGEGRLDTALPGRIEVPFCPEAELSGIGKTDFIDDCVYSKTVQLEARDLAERLVLHFGAVDYEAKVYVNGQHIITHVGGYTAFEADITAAAHVGKNRITVVVHDDMRENIPSGKQTRKRHSYGCFYTRTTGIWQSVWLERTPAAYLKKIRFFPDVAKSAVRVELETEGSGPVSLAVSFDGRKMGEAGGEMAFRHSFTIPLAESHLWTVGKGNLYRVDVAFGEDRVKSYFGLREVGYQGRTFLLNGEKVFQRLVLDQGYYVGGNYTAPSVELMRQDIQRGLSLGFNGARLHQKVFEQRFLYECDRAGYMVWGEFPSWGVEYEKLDFLGRFISEWSETVEQYFNHPAIITWCPLNEAWSSQQDKRKVRDVRFVESVYAVTKALDSTRPCVDTSGGYHGWHTDVFDFHFYGPEVELDDCLSRLEREDVLMVETLYPPESAQEDIVCRGEVPINASEYGGIAYAGGGKQKRDMGTRTDRTEAITAEDGWGYCTCTDEGLFVQRYRQLTQRLLGCGKLSGFCYTQLYDVEQEENGFYTYPRQPKLSEAAMGQIAECNRAKAAIE